MYSREPEPRISESKRAAVGRDPGRDSLHATDSPTNIADFFEPGVKVFALPGWNNPRLYVPHGGVFSRWRQSRFYPASKLHARAFRAFLRGSVTFGFPRPRELRPESNEAWLLRDFVAETLPNFDSAVLLVSSPRSAAKVTAQVWDRKGNIIGYLKYAGSPTTLKRLENEFHITRELPKGIGPEVLKYDRMGHGTALLKRPLPGRAPKAEAVPGSGTLAILNLLPRSDELFGVGDHPFFKSLGEHEGFEERWLESLSRKEWPVVTQHGDFAPWNTLRVGTGEMSALDWEYGTTEGFPFLDHSYYILQTAALIHRRSSSEAAGIATEFLEETVGLPKDMAADIVRIAAFDAYTKFWIKENTAPDKLQNWRKDVWKNTNSSPGKSL